MVQLVNELINDILEKESSDGEKDSEMHYDEDTRQMDEDIDGNVQSQTPKDNKTFRGKPTNWICY